MPDSYSDLEGNLDLRDPAQREAVRYVRVVTSNAHPLVRKSRHTRHFLSWAARLLLPAFLVGHPNLFDNIRTLARHPNFRPLRMAIAAWAIFALAVGSSGIYVFRHAPSSHAADWYDHAWSYRKSITVDHTKVSADHADFPVLINLASDADLAPHASATGIDILFTSSDGTTKLNHEIESYSSSTGALAAWVRAPALSSSVDTLLYMYYGNSGAADQQNKAGVWDANYVAVWHLEETGAGTAGEYKDSTSYANDAQGGGGTAASVPTTASGKIGNAGNFDGSNDFLEAADSNSLDLTALATFSMWVKFDAVNRQNSLLSKKLSVWNASDGYQIYVANGAGGIFDFIGQGGNQDRSAFSPSADQWYYIVLTLDTAASPKTRHYVNDAVQTLSMNYSGSNLVAGTQKLRLGYESADFPGYLDGTLDEVRISNAARPAAWITTEYNNQSSPSTFYALGPEEAGNQPPATPVHSSPLNGALGQSLSPILSASAFSDADPGDTHAASRWLISSVSGDYASPIYDSTTTTTSLTSVTLPANTLIASSTYYWQVAYQDSVGNWSTTSTETSFTTSRPPAAPLNSSPSNGTVNTTITPTLSASAFSDPDPGATHYASQWQIRTINDAAYASPAYDSGTSTTALASLTVPAGELPENNTFYWRVRYEDQHGVWSPYSSETAFSTGVTPITIISVGATEYRSGEAARLVVQVLDADGSPVNTATTTFDMWDPSEVKIASGTAMSYIAASNGLYAYSTTTSATEGVYIYSVTAQYNGQDSHASHTFHVSPTLNAVSTLQTGINSISSTVGSVSSTLGSVHTTLNSVSSTVGNINSTVATINTNLDILIGAMIVTQSTVSDASPATTSFVTALTNATNNFYKNAVLTFTSGTLDGQTRRISAYNASTKAVTLDPALTSAPANGDAFTIVTQNVYAEEQLLTASTTLGNIQSTVNTINTNVSTILSTLNTVNTNLDAVQAKVNSLRTSQQLGYTVTLSHANAVQASSTYAATLSIENFESDPADASSTPTFAIYDSLGEVAQATTSMTRSSTGVYTLQFTVPADATAGLWKTAATVNVGGSSPITRTDYWQVTGAPAQVIINSMSDLTVPSIVADVTIQNEGNAAFEYQYEWCVVAAADNPCGGGDDVYRGTAAKLIQAGASFNTSLAATVPNAGAYYFKLVVYFGSQASGASLSFNAAPAGTSDSGTSGSSGGGGSGTFLLGTGNDIAQIRNALASQSVQLTRALELLGNVDPYSAGFRPLLTITAANTEDIKEVQNKIAELRAISAIARQVAESKSVAPIVESFMKFNSVEINFLITNPADSEQVVKFKSFLPAEAKPEHIIDASGLKVDYDPEAGSYFVSGDITLGPSATVTRKVEMKDIWLFPEEELASDRKQAENLVAALKKTNYEAQAALLKNDLETTVDAILRTQRASYTSPQDHIVAYRENVPRAERIKNDLQKLSDLVVEAGASQSLVGKVGGIQTFATWGIILAIVSGFAILAAAIFAMWRHQMALALTSMGYNREILRELDGHAGSRRSSSPAMAMPHAPIETRRRPVAGESGTSYGKMLAVVLGVMLLVAAGFFAMKTFGGGSRVIYIAPTSINTDGR